MSNLGREEDPKLYCHHLARGTGILWQEVFDLKPVKWVQTAPYRVSMIGQAVLHPLKEDIHWHCDLIYPRNQLIITLQKSLNWK